MYKWIARFRHIRLKSAYLTSYDVLGDLFEKLKLKRNTNNFGHVGYFGHAELDDIGTCRGRHHSAPTTPRLLTCRPSHARCMLCKLPPSSLLHATAVAQKWPSALIQYADLVVSPCPSASRSAELSPGRSLPPVLLLLTLTRTRGFYAKVSPARMALSTRSRPSSVLPAYLPIFMNRI